MNGYPALHFALLQGLLTTALLCTPPLLLAFGGGKLKLAPSDALLLLLVVPGGSLVTLVLFLPFEGDWADAAFGPLAALRPVIVGATLLLLGAIVTQLQGLSRRPPLEVAHRLGAALLIGAIWGALWSLSGWFLDSIGMVSNG